VPAQASLGRSDAIHCSDFAVACQSSQTQDKMRGIRLSNRALTIADSPCVCQQGNLVQMEERELPNSWPQLQLGKMTNKAAELLCSVLGCGRV